MCLGQVFNHNIHIKIVGLCTAMALCTYIKLR